MDNNSTAEFVERQQEYSKSSMTSSRRFQKCQLECSFVDRIHTIELKMYDVRLILIVGQEVEVAGLPSEIPQKSLYWQRDRRCGWENLELKRLFLTSIESRLVS